MGNQLLSYAGDIPGINLPDRVELVTELGHFVDGPPGPPLKSGRIFNVFSMYFQWISLLFARPGRASRPRPDLRGGRRQNIQNALALALIGLCWANLFGA